VLGPTKIYLAVQPPPTAVQQPAVASSVAVTSPTTAPSPATVQSPNKSQPKVVVQQVAQPETPSVRYVHGYGHLTLSVPGV
jgi:hypothetical protein